MNFYVYMIDKMYIATVPCKRMSFTLKYNFLILLLINGNTLLK